MPNLIEAAWLGRRVTVRRAVDRTADGRPLFADVVGDLVHLDSTHAVIEGRHGPVEVALAGVAVAKLAPPSTADELALEQVAAAGWRARETGWLGGWLLRADAGFTGRANSVLPLKAPGRPLPDAIEAARAWYADRGLPLRIMVPTEARRLLDADLGERGWDLEPDVHVMVKHLTAHAAAATPEPARPEVEVTIDATPDDAWLRRYRDGAGATDAARALLTRHDHAGFASIRDAGRVVAIGRAAIDAGWVGLSAIEVDPQRRRQGLGVAVTTALLEWARREGASRSYLQVSSDNAPAVALYERLGYWVHHDYRYRTDPGADAEVPQPWAGEPR